jgi:histidyl-tRNA synthetase
MEDKARDLALRFGYAELSPPIMEKTELFQRGIGEVTDIVEKEMYTMEDRSGEKITLRPEATAGLVRAVLEHNLCEGARPAKLFCFGPMFRYERPQKGRLRQFHQFDVEVFGDVGPYIDAEIILLLHTLLSELGINDLQVVVNSLGCPSCRPAFREKLTSFLSERQSSLCPDCRRRLEHNPLRILDCKNEQCRSEVMIGPKMDQFLCLSCKDHFQLLTTVLTQVNLNFRIDPLLVRGLDYYTRTTFEVHSGQLGAQSAVAGGGRYDGLCSKLGGADIPGLGFAVGLERLFMLLSQADSPKESGPDYYVAVLCPEALGPAFELVQNLRARGLKVEADWESGGLKSRLKRADKASAQRVIMLGPDEMAGGQATIRDLSTKQQWNLPLDQPQRY